MTEERIAQAIAKMNELRVARYVGKLTFMDCMRIACGYDKELRSAVGRHFGSKPKRHHVANDQQPELFKVVK